MIDWDTYTADQWDERNRVTETLRKLPEFRNSLDEFGRGPAITLLCPSGHKLLPVQVNDDGDKLTLRALPGTIRNSGAVTSNGEPFGANRTHMCPKDDCGKLVTSAGNSYCDEHGGPVEWIGTVRTVFTCRAPNCTFTQALTTARLLKLYGLAVALNRDSIPVADTPDAG